MALAKPKDEVAEALEAALGDTSSATTDHQRLEEDAMRSLIPQKGMPEDEIAAVIAANEGVVEEVTEPRQAFVFHATRPYLMVFINSKAREHAKRSMHGHITHKRGEEGHNIPLEFTNGRFVTFDPDFANLISFCIEKWPATYGCITAGHTVQQQLRARIERVRTEGTRRQLLGMIGVEGEDALLHHANRANDAGQSKVAEALLLAAENISTATGALVHKQESAA